LKLHTVDEFNNRTKHKIYTGKTFTPGIVGEPILKKRLAHIDLWYSLTRCVCLRNEILAVTWMKFIMLQLSMDLNTALVIYLQFICNVAMQENAKSSNLLTWYSVWLLGRFFPVLCRRM